MISTYAAQLGRAKLGALELGAFELPVPVGVTGPDSLLELYDTAAAWVTPWDISYGRALVTICALATAKSRDTAISATRNADRASGVMRSRP